MAAEPRLRPLLFVPETSPRCTGLRTAETARRIGQGALRLLVIVGTPSAVLQALEIRPQSRRRL